MLSSTRKFIDAITAILPQELDKCFSLGYNSLDFGQIAMSMQPSEAIGYRTMKTTLIALAALMTTGVASAQNGGENTLDLSGLTFKIGTAFPVDNRLSNFADNLLVTGIEVNVPTQFGSGSESYLSFDYFSRNLFGFGKGSALAVTFNQRFLKKSTAVRQTYGFAGLGFAFSDITTSDQLFLVRGGVGINLSQQTFMELAGTFSSTSSNDGALSTVGLYFGYRF
jgi:hypothetical protein